MNEIIILAYFLFGTGMGISQFDEKHNRLFDRVWTVFVFSLLWPVALGFYIGEKMKEELNDNRNKPR